MAAKKSLGDRMKEYELESLKVTHVEPYKSFVIRMDGNCFSKFTSSFDKPFDSIFLKCMIMTCGDLIQKFNACSGYTHSDEITLVIPAQCTKEEYDTETNKSVHMFNGRVTKIIGLTASFCSITFYKYLCEFVHESFRDRITKSIPIFDSRILIFDHEKQETEILNHFIWRSLYDCHKNAVSTYADYYVGKKKTFKMNTKEKIEELSKTEAPWYSVPDYYKSGMFLKKEQYTRKIEFVRKKSKDIEIVDAIRTRIIPFTINSLTVDDIHIDLIMSKYLSESFDGLVTSQIHEIECM
jgi:tRNA(His) guanylyltransferase